MELTTDFLLKGPTWREVVTKLTPIFKSKPKYMTFMLCLSLGILYDERIPSFDDETDQEPLNVPRNVIQNNDNGKIDLMLQAAVLTTKTLNLTEDERLELAFGDKKTDDLNRHDFLLSFANFGVTILANCVGDSTFESMEQIKSFLIDTIEGRNPRIDGLSDELLLEEDEEY